LLNVEFEGWLRGGCGGLAHNHSPIIGANLSLLIFLIASVLANRIIQG
jgi:hypothetical protein